MRTLKRKIIDPASMGHVLMIFISLSLIHSGLMYKSNFSIRRIPEVVANSGATLLHFFSDDAYNMSGFNISYRFDSCPTTDSCEYKINRIIDL